jgi:hypothetical protein
MSTRRVVDISDKSISESGLLRLRVDRQPDYGNVVQVPCTGCGKVAVLNPININREFWGAELVCPVCHGPTPVREADPDRPTPDPIAELYTPEHQCPEGRRPRRPLFRR